MCNCHHDLILEYFLPPQKQTLCPISIHKPVPSVPGSHSLLSVYNDAFILHILCEVMSLHFTTGVSSISSRSVPVALSNIWIVCVIKLRDLWGCECLCACVCLYMAFDCGYSSLKGCADHHQSIPFLLKLFSLSWRWWDNQLHASSMLYVTAILKTARIWA